MIICKYKDGSSIRVYKTKQQRGKAIAALKNMGIFSLKLDDCPDHYSLKTCDAILSSRETFNSFMEQIKRIIQDKIIHLGGLP